MHFHKTFFTLFCFFFLNQIVFAPPKPSYLSATANSLDANAPSFVPLSTTVPPATALNANATSFVPLSTAVSPATTSHVKAQPPVSRYSFGTKSTQPPLPAAHHATGYSTYGHSVHFPPPYIPVPAQAALSTAETASTTAVYNYHPALATPPPHPPARAATLPPALYATHFTPPPTQAAVSAENRQLLDQVFRLPLDRCFDELYKYKDHPSFSNLLNSENSDGFTPLYIAAQTESQYLINCLIRWGAKVDSRCHGATPLIIAVQFNNKTAVEELLINGANKDAKTDPRTYAPGEGPHASGATPLIIAIYDKHYELAQLLLSHKADPNIQTNEEGFSALHYAVNADDQEAIRILLTSPSIKRELKDKQGKTPLDYAKNEETKNMLRHFSFR